MRPSLIDGREWGPGGGTAVSLSYSFITSVPGYYDSDAQERDNFVAFTTDMQDAVRLALDDISTFTNIIFTEVSGVGDITFGQANLTTVYTLILWHGHIIPIKVVLAEMYGLTSTIT